MAVGAVSNKSILAETAGWFKTGTGIESLALKPLQYLFEGMKQEGVNTGVTDHILKDVKLARLYLAGPELASHVYEFSCHIGEGDVAGAVLDSISAVDPAFKLVSLSNHYGDFLSDSAVEGLKAAGAGALLTGSTWGAVNDISALVNAGKALETAGSPQEIDMEKARIVHSSLSLAKKIVYVALAAITLVGIVFAIAFSPWIGLALSITALVLTISTFFADKSLGYAARKGQTPPTLPTDFFKGADWAKVVVGGDDGAKMKAFAAELTKRSKAADDPKKQAEFAKQVQELAENAEVQTALGGKDKAKAAVDAVLLKFKQDAALVDVEAQFRKAVAKTDKGQIATVLGAQADALAADEGLQKLFAIEGSAGEKKTALAAILKPVVEKLARELTTKK